MKAERYISLIKQAQRVKKIFKKDKSIKGFGISMLSVDEMKSLIDRDKNFLNDYFTPEEIIYCKNRITSLAGRFAAKIAVREALQKQISWKYINILSSQSQQPVLSLKNINTDNDNQNISISITHEDDLTVAVAAVSSPGNTVSVGIDAAKIARIITAIKNQPGIIQRIFTKKEQAAIYKFRAGAAIWAGKEAVSKVLGVGIWHGAQLPDIEILSDNTDTKVKLKGKLQLAAKELGLVRWKLINIKDEMYELAVVAATSV